MNRLVVLLALLVTIKSARAGPDSAALPPEDPASPVHPRKFGLPGGVGTTRGWYIWRSFDAKTWQAQVSHEGTGQNYSVRVLPWATTYRHLAYGAQPSDLLPGERVNLFFNADAKQQRAYLVHFQDEIGQMKGHNHAWRVDQAAEDGRSFTALVLAGDKALDDKLAAFELDPKCRIWRNGKLSDDADVKAGQTLYFTWVYLKQRRVVKLLSDAASLDALRKEAQRKAADHVQGEGMTGFVEDADAKKSRLLIFATWWAQAADLKPGQDLRLHATDAAYRPTGDPIAVKLAARKNLGTYGSGCTEVILETLTGEQTTRLKGWTGNNKVIRIVPK